MSLIKPLLILSAIALLIWAFRYRARVGLRASVRLLALVLTVAAIASVVHPGFTQDAANLVGVTRGTDLLLYVTVVIFAFTTVGFLFRFREADRRQAKLVRAMAIRDAVRDRGIPGEVDDPNGRSSD